MNEQPHPQSEEGDREMTGPGTDRPGATTGTSGREQDTGYDKSTAAADLNPGHGDTGSPGNDQ